MGVSAALANLLSDAVVCNVSRTGFCAFFGTARSAITHLSFKIPNAF